MGGFLDADGRLTKAAVLNKATLTLHAGGTGWAFPARVDLAAIARQVGVRASAITEARDDNGDTARARGGGKAVNRKA